MTIWPARPPASSWRHRVRFLRSRAPAVTRVLELTGVAERLPFVDADRLDYSTT